MKEIITEFKDTTVKICIFKNGQFLVYVKASSNYGSGFILIETNNLFNSMRRNMHELAIHVKSILLSNGYSLTENDTHDLIKLTEKR